MSLTERELRLLRADLTKANKAKGQAGKGALRGAAIITLILWTLAVLAELADHHLSFVFSIFFGVAIGIVLWIWMWIDEVCTLNRRIRSIEDNLARGTAQGVLVADMNDADIQRIESALGKKLPDPYKAVLMSHPFGEDSCGFDCYLCDGADALIEMNKSVSFHGRLHPKAAQSHPLKQEQYLCIGNDGGEEEYFLDISRPLAPVMRFDLETGTLSEYAKDIHEYIEKIREIDKEIEEDQKTMEDRRRTAKWWQFWRRL